MYTKQNQNRELLKVNDRTQIGKKNYTLHDISYIIDIRVL